MRRMTPQLFLTWTATTFLPKSRILLKTSRKGELARKEAVGKSGSGVSDSNPSVSDPSIASEPPVVDDPPADGPIANKDKYHTGVNEPVWGNVTDNDEVSSVRWERDGIDQGALELAGGNFSATNRVKQSR